MPSAAKKLSRRSTKQSGANSLGALPEWNLTDLYPAIDAPEVSRDLDRADAECLAFEKSYKGGLAELAARPSGGRSLAEAVKGYEAIEDTLGRLISYAGLVHAGDTVDPTRAKFYGDVRDRITAASTHLLFFELELNRIADEVLDRAMQDPAARPLPPLAVGHPQGEAVSA